VQNICHIEFFSHFEFSRKKISLKNMNNWPNLNNLEDILKKNKFTSFKRENRFASILNLGAIFKFHAWQHWFYNKKSMKVKKIWT
jgi:hypothetical protein